MSGVSRHGGSHLLRPLTLKNAASLSHLFAAALLLSALLLFWIQPLYSKMVLPRYGGTPAVWTTASMFFQVMLLAGYLYAHLVTRKLGLKHQVWLHFTLLGVVFLVLPAQIDESWTAFSGQAPVVSLLGLLIIDLGLPFFAVAATAPLLQRWFSQTSHAEAVDPYFLYAASNIGSMAALLGYPLLLEPLFGLNRQSILWACGYALLVVLIVACAANARQYREPESAASVAAAPSAPLGWRKRALWILLAFAPSSLMLGVTQHITTEIAPVPLLWIAPLAIYVLTFVNAFARRPAVKLEWTVKLQPLLVGSLALVWILNDYISVFLLHLLAFFVTALMCHAELARQRPKVSRLTEFYLLMALGGALGGVFNAVAPLVFNAILEYPIAVALACMLRPVTRREDAALRWTDITFPLVLAGVYATFIALGIRPLELGKASIVIYLLVIGVTLYAFYERPIRFGLGVLVVLIASAPLHTAEQVLEKRRSFFGVHSVLKDKTGRFHVLMHGTTIHGAQYTAPEKRRELTSYFHRDNPLGQMFSALGTKHRFRRVALVGLGAGTAACYRQPGQEWIFFEIDPVVVRLATDTRYFSFLADCAPGARIVLGDGRLSLTAVPDRFFDLIIIDVFSSDAIPVHLITREALALYVRKLRDGGIVTIHITNQFIDLTPVLANLTAAAGLAALIPGPRFMLQLDDDRFARMESHWVAVAQTPEDLAALETAEGWVRMPQRSAARLWTDDFSNILGALKWNR